MSDIHKQTATKVFNIPENQVTSDQRADVRAINFGITYGSNREGMTQRSFAQMAAYQSMYKGGYSDMSAVKATDDVYRRLLDVADDPDPIVQLERWLMARHWAEARKPIRMTSIVVLAALAGFTEDE